MRTCAIPSLQLNLFFSLNFKICFRKIKRILIQRSSRLKGAQNRSVQHLGAEGMCQNGCVNPILLACCFAFILFLLCSSTEKSFRCVWFFWLGFFWYYLKSPVPKNFRDPGSFGKIFCAQKQSLRNSDCDSLLNRSTQWSKCKLSDQITTLLIHQTSTPEDSC